MNLVFDGLCEVCFEELSVQSVQNMGIPECFYCGYCGNKCTQEEIVEHVTNKCYIKLVKVWKF